MNYSNIAVPQQSQYLSKISLTIVAVHVFLTISIITIPDIVNSQSLNRNDIKILDDVELFRNPLIPSPSPNELQILSMQEKSWGEPKSIDSRFYGLIGNLLKRADISSEVNILVESDMKLNPNPSINSISGGWTTHSYIGIDGKLLTILQDIANYSTLKVLNIVDENPIQAYNNIVDFHVNSNGQSESLLYSYSMIPEEEIGTANEVSFAMIGTIVYHEFSHFFNYDMLRSLRLQSLFGPNGALILVKRHDEDIADLVAGALVCKAGLRADIGYQMYDIMFYSTARRMGQLNSFAQLSNSFNLQFGQLHFNYSSLMHRKNLFIKGAQLYKKLYPNSCEIKLD